MASRDLINEQFVAHGARMDRVASCRHCDQGGPVTPEPTKTGVRIVCNYCWTKTPPFKDINDAVDRWTELQRAAKQKSK
ncbi:hypothetical protein [Leisingera aquaemixtae]|uniref:Uncharacterized protein n=1 Tax=Leisingera aquaemixtae TaxID=1396826 RepID=A0A0P1HCE4_9RHOB|nr:hypothetical protein [Leisingera aquaemixtae]CUI01113.1 hypothetical protein PHA8399_03254 [Leisingera aquaemixtae]